ncbi:MAG: 50S ribosomal protein L28 [Candidatus Xiphinematobacter sp.]|nr:MAG: 50S ribosomal protein L28 [Candidatus Xiphinematobacter sp.]QQY09453.1 MAG: 50S ribosomal protein L28 [Candidatus Xiphinematobacter sp.]QQY10212.1 MAG: 50S ribosomal protein L28 [Candidatus Xiphinematobacter sp.]QQY10943.1 MAG: 50S ribosomal protein L28 [Candidatus Xiphinematobacter sp.]QQY11467.1 MAG: 50S ribosomal protein L28 [Candidatus Xiphinematobacter sp.]
MARRCSVTGAKSTHGTRIHRRGLAKKRGGIGMHVTAVTPREFFPNLRCRRVWVPQLGKFVRVKRMTANALKTVAKNGAFKALQSAGIL